MARTAGPCLILIFTLLAASGAEAQDAGQGVVIARVTNMESGAPLADVLVRLTEWRAGSLTDRSGVARFRGVPSGRYTVEARRVGYAPVTTFVRVAGTDTVEIVLIMRPTTIRLSRMTITDTTTPIALREFEQRRRAGTGRYITQGQIEQAFGSTLDGLLVSRLPGVHAGATIWNQRGPGAHCNLVAYLDGVHLLNDVVADIDPAQLGGVEYYTATTIPVQYRTPSSKHPRSTRDGGGGLGCGVILFWSKAK